VILIIGGFLIFRFVSARQNNEEAEVQTTVSATSDDLLSKWQNEINEEDKS